MLWCKMCAISRYAQLCSSVSKTENQGGQAAMYFLLHFVENDPWLGLVWSLLINIYEDNAWKLLLNAFMKNVHILGSLSFRAAAWKHNLCGEAENVHRRFVKWCIVRQLKIKSSAQWHHLAVRHMSGSAISKLSELGKILLSFWTYVSSSLKWEC